MKKNPFNAVKKKVPLLFRWVVGNKVIWFNVACYMQREKAIRILVYNLYLHNWLIYWFFNEFVADWQGIMFLVSHFSFFPNTFDFSVIGIIFETSYCCNTCGQKWATLLKFYNHVHWFITTIYVHNFSLRFVISIT